MDVNDKSPHLNSVTAHCNSDITICNAVHMLQHLLDSSRFNETKIKNIVALLKQIKNNVVHCEDVSETVLEKNSCTQGVEESSTSAAEIDEIIKRAESLLNILEDQAFETKFNGETVDWFRFWEAFKREIHDREDLPLALKFSCLKERLEGWPLNMLEKLGSGDSIYYDVALKLLQTTFSNKKVLFESHWNALLNLDPSDDTPVSLMRLSSEFEYHIKALEAYGSSIKEISSIVVPVLSKKIPKHIWNRIKKAEGTNHWNLLEFQNALKFEIQLLILKCSPQINNHSAEGTKNVSIDTLGDDIACKNEVEEVKDFEDSSNYSLTCQLCTKYHMLNDCTLFKTPIEKLERAKQLGFCLLCFNADHKTDECLETGCELCNGRHSTLFCISGTSEVESKKTDVKKKKNYCPLCSQSHDITGCTVYKTSVEKLMRTAELQLCLLCFKDEHLTENCLKENGCTICKEKHNTLLCVSANSKVCKANKNSNNIIKLCTFCSGPHCLDICPAYKTSAERLERSKELGLCLLCMKDDHITEKCLKKRGCKFCEEKHNILVCLLAKSRFCNNTSKKMEKKKSSKKREKRRPSCPLCSGLHETTSCSAYKTSIEKMERAKELQLCLLCVKDEHTTEMCSKTRRCKFCKGKHNSLLCVPATSKVCSESEKNTKIKKDIKSCPLCSKYHDITGCTIYKSPIEKMERAEELNLCLVCINAEHITERCTRTTWCKLCKGKHNTLLCNLGKSNIDKIQPSVNRIEQENLRCSLCSGSNHQFGGCSKFNTPLKKHEKALILNLCLLCLEDNHRTSECLRKKYCKYCKDKHNTQLCLETPTPKKKKTKKQKQEGEKQSRGLKVSSIQGIKSKTDRHKSFLCNLCSGNHHSFGCLKYTRPIERRSRAEDLNLCLVCTSKRHLTSECLKPDVCKFCHARHHSLLCINLKAKIKRRKKIRQEKQGSLHGEGKRGAISNNSLILDFIASSPI